MNQINPDCEWRFEDFVLARSRLFRSRVGSRDDGSEPLLVPELCFFQSSSNGNVRFSAAVTVRVTDFPGKTALTIEDGHVLLRVRPQYAASASAFSSCGSFRFL